MIRVQRLTHAGSLPGPHIAHLAFRWVGEVRRNAVTFSEGEIARPIGPGDKGPSGASPLITSVGRHDRGKGMLELPANGSCQCGECRYSVSAPAYVAYACHCTECQRLSSSAFASLMHVPSESVELTGGSPATRERTADSGNVLETWFCSSCGSTLFARNSSRPRVRTIHIGTLEHAERVEIEAHIWVKGKWPWVEVPKSHRVFEGAGDWSEDYADDPSRYRST